MNKIINIFKPKRVNLYEEVPMEFKKVFESLIESVGNEVNKVLGTNFEIARILKEEHSKENRCFCAVSQKNESFLLYPVDIYNRALKYKIAFENFQYLTIHSIAYSIRLLSTLKGFTKELASKDALRFADNFADEYIQKNGIKSEIKIKI